MALGRGLRSRCQAAPIRVRVQVCNHSTRSTPHLDGDHSPTLTPNHQPQDAAAKASHTVDDISELPLLDHTRRLTYTQSPNPAWKLGQKTAELAEEDARRKHWDMGTTSPRDAYKLMTSAIIPRPIAFVSTISNEGIPNLAPFSYFSMVSHNPPMVSISFSISRRRPKDTRENILSTREFTVNIISESFVEAANATSVESPATTDEWILSGLTPKPSLSVKPPLVHESSVSLECELYSFQDICAPRTSHITTTVVLGLIKHMHVRENVLDDTGEAVDPGKLQPVSRLGGVRYGRVTEAFELPRIDWDAMGGSYNGLLG